MLRYQFETGFRVWGLGFRVSAVLLGSLLFRLETQGACGMRRQKSLNLHPSIEGGLARQLQRKSDDSTMRNR